MTGNCNKEIQVGKLYKLIPISFGKDPPGTNRKFFHVFDKATKQWYVLATKNKNNVALAVNIKKELSRVSKPFDLVEILYDNKIFLISFDDLKEATETDL